MWYKAEYENNTPGVTRRAELQQSFQEWMLTLARDGLSTDNVGMLFKDSEDNTTTTIYFTPDAEVFAMGHGAEQCDAPDQGGIGILVSGELDTDFLFPP